MVKCVNRPAPVQAKELIVKGADRNGRVVLINPKKTLELAGVKL